MAVELDYHSPSRTKPSRIRCQSLRMVLVEVEPGKACLGMPPVAPLARRLDPAIRRLGGRPSGIRRLRAGYERLFDRS